MSGGRFITLEGGEGVGKSTQATRLAARLRAHGIDPLVSREPGGTAGAEAIRRLLVEGEAGRWVPMAETLLHMAARIEHVTRVIRPALAAGRWVICDRFVDSTRVYQGLLQGVGDARVMELHAIALDGFLPHRTLVLDLPAATGLARAVGRGEAETRYESMGDDFHRRVGEAFRNLAAADPGRCRLVDASGDPDTVAERIWQAVHDLLDDAGQDI
ncbi:MAG: dTMP kinase [Rhodothalassiaceae bacterium]